MTGVGQSLYMPMNTSKRGDFILMLIKATGLQKVFGSNFSDVPADSYYYNAIGTAKALGITSGTGNDLFSPKSGITRQDMLVQVYKALKTAGITMETANVSELDKFLDSNQVSNYAREALAVMVKNGYVSGSGSKLNPKSLATRAEIAVVLSKIKLN